MKGGWLTILAIIAAFSSQAQGIAPTEPAPPRTLRRFPSGGGSGRFSSDTIQFKQLFPENPESGKLSQWLRSTLTRRRNAASERELMRRENEYYDRFEGRTIGNIHIFRNNVFDGEEKLRWPERVANATHVVTKEKPIRRDLLFEPGDTINSMLMMSNRRLIRSRNYIADVNILIVPQEIDSTIVDVYVITRDKWSISADASFGGDGKSFIELYDNNIFGWGNKLSITTSFDWKHRFDYGGNGFEYEIPNIAGSFFSGRLVARKHFDISEYGMEINKEFIRPTDYAVGLSILRKRERIHMYAQDTTIKTTWQAVDFWGGRSLYIPAWKSSLYFSGRVSYLDYLERPPVSKYLNPYFHNETLLLTEIGIYKERFRTTNRIYGYGINEYVAHGYKLGLNTGYSWGEFGNRWYLGLNVAGGTFTRLGYFGGSIGLGSYLNHHDGKFYRSALVSEFRYFSNLQGERRYPVRQFVTIGITRGWNRLEGYQEVIGFTDDMQLRALNRRVFGQNRLLMNTETVVFTPWHIYEFRFALFGFLDMGLIGNYGNFFKNDFYSTIGLGVRIKNEHLIFNTISIRLGVALGKNGLVESQYFRIDNSERMALMRFIPQKPIVIPYQ